MTLLSDISQQDLEQLLYMDLFLLNRRSNEEKQKLRDAWLKEFLFMKLTLPAAQKTQTLFFRSLVRPDYKNLFHTVIDASDLSEKVIVEDYLSQGQTFNLDASAYMRDNVAITERLLFVPDALSRRCLSIKLMSYAYRVDALKRYDFDTLVCFSDMQPVEHLAALYFRAQGKATVTLQHGLYVDYGDWDTVNVVNYRHQPSEYFLAWGNHTADLIARHHPANKRVICGKPDIQLANSDATRGRDVLLILDQEIFQSQNFEMIKIAQKMTEQTGRRLRVRFHPHNNLPYYKKVFPNLDDTAPELNHVGLVLGHTSSLLYEAAAQGFQVAQYVSDIPTIPLEKPLQFTTLEQLMAQQQNPPRIEKRDLPIAAIGPDAKARYRSFFSALSQKQARPKFSIIVPCFKSALHIQRCLDSIKQQSFEDYEVVIVDGASPDMTVKIALSYARTDPRIRVFSEPDKGVYDAMNKGIARARGEWLYFMGSDDEFADDDVLSGIAMAIKTTNTDMIYGNVRVVGDVKWAKDGTIYDGAFSTEKIQKQNICHQAIFYRSSAIQKAGFYNIKYKICADWDMNLKIWAKSGGHYIDRIISNFNAGGESTDGSDPVFGKDFVANKKLYFGAERAI